MRKLNKICDKEQVYDFLRTYKSEFDKIIPSSRPALTKERVLEIAKSCKSYAEFRNHRGCLKWAKKNNFLRELKKVLPPKTLIQASIPQRIKIMKKVAAICKKTGLSQAKVLDQLNIEKSKFCKWKLAHKKLAKRLGLRPRR
jgi:predicted XRE-type DNA-binding protein